MKIDAASHGIYGAPPARNPITGEAKTERESIREFAQRHGWEVAHYGKGPDDYVITARFVKGERRVDLSLFDKFRVCTAEINQIGLSGAGPLRTRVEKYLVGVECICVLPPDMNHWTRVEPDPACPIHGGA